MTAGFRGIGEGLTRAEQVASEIVRELSGRGVQVAIIGGLAVVSHGYPRSTADVDLLVTDRNAIQGSALGIPGVTFKRDGVPVDVLFVGENDRAMRLAVHEASAGDPPIIALAPLIALKLRAGRSRDHADIVELLKVDMLRAIDVRSWLRWNARDVADKFERLVLVARAELPEAG